MYFQWDDACQVVFYNLKLKLTEMVILAHPDPYKECILMPPIDWHMFVPTGLSSEGEERSKKTKQFILYLISDMQTRWSTIDKEVYAIH